MKLQHGKTYITRGGFVVEIFKIAGAFFASKRTSPGTLGGKTAEEFVKACGYSEDRCNLGWQYYDDGVISSRGFLHSLYDDLIIVGESSFSLSDIPKEYTWEGEFPRIRELTNDDKFFLSYSGQFKKHADCVHFNFGWMGTKRLPLVAIESNSTEPRYYKSATGTDFYIYKDGKWYYQDINGVFPSCYSDNYLRKLIQSGEYVSISKEDVDNFLKEDCKYYFRKDDHGSAYYVNKNGQWCRYSKKEEREVQDGSAQSWWQNEINTGKLIPCTKEYALSLPKVYWPTTTGNYKFVLDDQGMPVYRRPRDGEYFIKYSSQTKHYGEIVQSKNYSTPLDVEDRRFILESVDSSPISSKQEPLSATVVDNKLNDGPAAHNNKEKEEVVMKKETAIAIGTSVAKFVGNWGFRTFNYWVAEPATNIARPIVKTVRYAVFIGTIAGSIYAYRNPDVVVKTLKSCLPKVSIEAPEILS